MDDPSLPADEHMAALDALARINRLSRTASQLAVGIERVVSGGRRSGGDEPIRVLDLACGGGDVTVALAVALDRSRRRGRMGPVTVTGIDMSHRAVERARALANSAGLERVTFAMGDVVGEGCPPCDVAVSSLFLHHLDDPSTETVLRRMALASRCGVVVSDLIRSRVGLALAVIGTNVLCGSRVARVDGPLSVRAARTPIEYRRICGRAGLDGALLRRTWPERMVIEWVKPVAAIQSADGANI